jgi:hypothetical protein
MAAVTVAAAVPVLGSRALNRALLDRQLLLKRRSWSPAAVIERLVGMQAQVPLAPYVGLWARVEGFNPDQLARLLIRRRVVRSVLMRGTIHLVTAPDLLALRPLVQPLLDRDLDVNAEHAEALRGIDRAEVAAVARVLYEVRPQTNAEMTDALAAHWPDRRARSLMHAARGLLPLVQVPPRGLWGRSGPVTCSTAEAWLGAPLAAEPSIDDLVRRYLGAFGPASVRDVQTWSGLTGLSEVLERLRPALRVARDEDGRELFDLPRAPRPDPDTPAPVRFLGEFDNILLSHADRRRIMTDAQRRAIFSRNGLVASVVLVDGFVRATWRLERPPERRGADNSKGGAVVTVHPLAPVGPADRDAITAEAGRLLAFAAEGEEPDVRIGAVT